ncbi:hypothetical protein GF406_15795 [candidate division KSB1 bacterium]|nr:hypothetical protein [candidate division KSB1 bacterium]
MMIRVLWVLLFSSCQLYGQINCLGVRGAGFTPSAYLLGDGVVAFTTRQVASEHLPLVKGHDNTVYTAGMGFLPFMDIHFAFIRPQDHSFGAVDRTVCFRLNLLKESNWLPQLTTGFRDPFGGTTVSGKTGQKMSVTYLVASKTLTALPVLETLQLDLGYGSSWPSKENRNRHSYLLGWFASLHIHPLPFASIYLEHDANRLNYGTILSFKFVQGFLMVSDLEDVSFGLGVGFGLR